MVESEFNKQKKSANRLLNPARMNEMSKNFNEQMHKHIEAQSKTEINKDYLSLRDTIKPTFGVNYQEGKDVSMLGPTYKDKYLNEVKLSLREYKDKYETHNLQHRGIQKHQANNF